MDKLFEELAPALAKMNEAFGDFREKFAEAGAAFTVAMKELGATVAAALEQAAEESRNEQERPDDLAD